MAAPYEESTSSSDEDSTAVQVASLESFLRERLADLDRRVASLEKKASDRTACRSEEDTAFLVKEETCKEEDVPEYSLAGSAWNMVFLAGCSIGLDGSSEALMVLGALVNVAVQLAFCWVLTDSHWISTTLEGEQYGAWRWRMTIGHALSNADPMTGSSLVSRVCKEDKALSTSTTQFSLHDSITAYFDKSGPMLVLSVLLVHTMSCCVELYDIVHFGWGICGLARGRRTRVERRDGHVRISCTSSGRHVLGLLVVLLRLAVALVIFYSGLMWLVKTVDIETLLLNCVALSFILQVDELVYACFASMRLERLLREMEPLKCVGSTRPHCGFFRPFMALGLFAFLAFTFLCRLQPLWGSLHEIERHLCGGNQDFVYGVDSLGAMYYTHTTGYNVTPRSNITERVFENRMSLVEEIMRWNHTEDPTGTHLWPKTQQFSMQRLTEKMKRQVVYYSESKEECRDETLETFAYLVLGSETQDCSRINASRFCNEPESAALRLRCPKTCGCNSPISGLVLRDPMYGCPSVCEGTRDFRNVLEALPCRQRNGKDMLRVASSSRDWVAGWKRFFANHRPPGSEDPDWGDENLAEIGCEGMAPFISTKRNLDPNYTLFDICATGMAAFCPETCGCRQEPGGITEMWKAHNWGNVTYCPKQCASKAPIRDIPYL